MIYLSLPYFYENLNFNLKFKNFLRDNPDAQNFTQQCVLESCYGNFPFSFWNGDKNNNFQDYRIVLTREDIQNFLINDLYSILKFDFSNIYLTEKDFYDPHLNMILDECKGYGNFIKVNNTKLIDYINSKYNGYDFILSENAFIYNLFSVDEINTLLDTDSIFYGIELPSLFNLSLEDFLIKIKNKNKVTLTVGDRCQNCSFEKWKECKSIENNYQINFSINTIDMNEGIVINNNSLYEEIIKLNKLGFSYFKIKPFTNNLILFNDILIQTFIKPTFQGDFYRRLYND